MHHVEPTLIEESPDVAITHVGTNDVRTSTSAEDIAKIIINIGRKCVSKGVNKVFISSLLQRSSFHDTRKVRLVNDFLREFCTKEGFLYICNDFISKDFLWKDGVHLLDKGTNMLVNNFISSLKNY